MLRRNDPKGGRPSKKTKATIDKILALVRDGNYYCVAAKAAGISYETLRRWIRTDVELQQAIKIAESEAEATNVAEIRKAGKRNWTARAWLLERRWPQRWAKREQPAAGVGKLDQEHPIVTALPQGYTIDLPDGDDGA